jgi:hypothetical protein
MNTDRFSIVAAAHTITLAAQLPVIATDLTIDGSVSQAWQRAEHECADQGGLNAQLTIEIVGWRHRLLLHVQPGRSAPLTFRAWRSRDSAT